MNVRHADPYAPFHGRAPTDLGTARMIPGRADGFAKPGSSSRNSQSVSDSVFMSLFISVFAMRMISEGIDKYLGTPLSLALTLLLTLISMSYVLLHGKITHRALLLLTFSLPFLASALISLVANLDRQPVEQLGQFQKYFTYMSILIFAAVSKWTRQHARLLLITMLWTTSIELVFSVYQVVSGTGFRDFVFDEVRGLGLTSHPVFLGIKLFTLLVMVYTFRSLLSKKVLLLYYIVIAGNMALTFGRTAWLMCSLWLAVIIWRSKGVGIRAFLLIVVVPAIIALMIFSGRFDDLTDIGQFIRSGYYRSFDWTTMNSSFEWRLVQWYSLFQVALEQPWIGHGLRVESLFNEFNRNSHNSFLDILVNQGILGLMTFVLLLAAIYVQISAGLQSLRISRTLIDKIRTSILSVWVAYIIGMIFGASIFDSTLSMLVFLIFNGLAINPYFVRHLIPRRAPAPMPGGR